jgi:hypothetical protein
MKRENKVKIPPGKTRITIRIDNDILQDFRDQVKTAGAGSYQALINRALRAQIESGGETLRETLRSVVAEELSKHAKKQKTTVTKAVRRALKNLS